MAMTNDERDQLLITLRVKLEQIEKQFETFITRVEFWPVKMFVMGLSSLVLLGVGAAILRLVVMAKDSVP